MLQQTKQPLTRISCFRYNFVFQHLIDDLGKRLLVFVDSRVYGKGVATELLRRDAVFSKLGKKLIVHETTSPTDWKALFMFMDILSEEAPDDHFGEDDAEDPEVEEHVLMTTHNCALCSCDSSTKRHKTS